MALLDRRSDVCYCIIIALCIVLLFYSPDPTLTVGNVVGVMEKVTDGRHTEVWQELFGKTDLKDISSECSTKEEVIRTCSDIYVHCFPDSCWEALSRVLRLMGETAAIEEVKSYHNPKGKHRFISADFICICHRVGRLYK